MISSQRLLNAINERVVNWQFSHCYESEKLAKKEAAKMYAKDGVQGVTVGPIGHGKFATFYWEKEKEI